MNEVNNCNKPLYEQSVRLPAAIISIQKVQNRDTQDLEYSIQLRYMPVIDRSVTGIAMKGNAWVVYNRKVEVISFVVQFGSQTNLNAHSQVLCYGQCVSERNHRVSVVSLISSSLG